MPDTLIEETTPEGVCVLTFNRPDVLNAIDMAMAEHLAARLTAIERDEDVRCLVLTGAGRAFSAGFDIAELATFDTDGMMHAFVTRDPIFHRIARFPKPVIAVLNGITYGAGALIAAACDIRIGGDAMRFKVTAAAYGSANATWSLPRIVGVAKAKELLMTARVVGAAEALAIGLVNHVTDEPLAAAIAMGQSIAANPPHGVAGVKMLVDASQNRTLNDGWRAEFDWMVEQMTSSAMGGADVFGSFLGRRT